MAEIFAASLTHYSVLIAPDEDNMYPLLRTLKNDERLPESLKDPCLLYTSDAADE